MGKDTVCMCKTLPRCWDQAVNLCDLRRETVSSGYVKYTQSINTHNRLADIWDGNRYRIEVDAVARGDGFTVTTSKLCL